MLCYVGVEPTLFYFKDEKHRKQGKPKGTKNLIILRSLNTEMQYMILLAIVALNRAYSILLPHPKKI